MKLIIAVMAMLLPMLPFGQSKSPGTNSPKHLEGIRPYTIGERLPDLPLLNLINYDNCAVSLSSFGDKIIILDFWNTWCTSCIRMFPLEDSLQAMFHEDVQFILITDDSKEKVEKFLLKYNGTRKTPLALPIITQDSAFSRLFRFSYIPHYVWIAPNGLILAESSDWFINKENIQNVLTPIREEEKRIQGNKYAGINLHMLQPTKELLQQLSLIDN